jgi:hypothetical protein
MEAEEQEEKIILRNNKYMVTIQFSINNFKT